MTVYKSIHLGVSVLLMKDLGEFMKRGTNASKVNRTSCAQNDSLTFNHDDFPFQL